MRDRRFHALAVSLGDRSASGLMAAGSLLMLAGVVLHLAESHGHEHEHAAIEHEHAHRHDDRHHDHVHEPVADGEHSHKIVTCRPGTRIPVCPMFTTYITTESVSGQSVPIAAEFRPNDSGSDAAA